MSRFYFSISSLLFLFWVCWSVVWFTAFTPAAMISMTGSVEGSSMVGTIRFDVSAYTEDFASLNPRLDISTKVFTWGFYSDGVGWFTFQNGSDVVRLDCGIQSLSSLSAKCTLSGTGWGENVGYLQFGTPNSVVDYIPSLWVLSGSAWSQAVWPVKLDGIYLPLRPAALEDMDQLIASNSANLTISWAEWYGYTVDGWKLVFAPTNANMYIQVLTSADGIFGGADTTIAGKYTYTITDPSGSITADVWTMRVFPGKMSKTPYVSATNLSTYCTNETTPLVSICPDGKGNLRSTYFSGGLFINPKKTSALSDGIDSLDIIVALRDTYGNAIMTDSDTILKLKVSTINTVKKCQILDDSDVSENMNICDSVADLTSSPVVFNSSPSLNIMNWSTLGSNPDLSMSSIAPTNTKNTLTLTAIDYSFLSGSLEIHSGSVLSLPIQTTFRPLFTLSGLTIDGLHVSSPTTVNGEIVQQTTAATPTIPRIVHGLSIGSGVGANSSFHFEPVDTWPCSAFYGESTYTGDCAWESWLDGFISPTVGSESFVVGNFTKRWNLVTVLPTLTETAWFIPVFTYQMGTETIAYYGNTIDLSHSEITVAPNILFTGNMGKTGNSTYTGTSLSTSSEAVANTLNLLRKNSALLSRSRANYSTTDYIVFNTGTDAHIDQAMMAGKRAIIVVGSDAIITENLTGSDLKPRAIIALADSNGSGGNIIIENGVRDIYASLLSDRALISGTKVGDTITPYDVGSKNNQLYIRGSVMTQNTVGGWCPALIKNCTPATDYLYDLDFFRSGYHGVPAAERPSHMANDPVAQKYPGSSLVIDYDPAILQDPPTGLRTERQ